MIWFSVPNKQSIFSFLLLNQNTNPLKNVLYQTLLTYTTKNRSPSYLQSPLLRHLHQTNSPSPTGHPCHQPIIQQRENKRKWKRDRLRESEEEKGRKRGILEPALGFKPTVTGDGTSGDAAEPIVDATKPTAQQPWVSLRCRGKRKRRSGGTPVN